MQNMFFRHKLPYMFDGTNSIFFNGSFYFHRAGTPKIGRYELYSKRYSEVVIEDAAHRGDNVSLAKICISDIIYPFLILV